MTKIECPLILRSVIGLITVEIDNLIANTINLIPPEGNGRDIIIINIQYNFKVLNPSVIVEIRSSKVDGTIGVWCSQTSDISIFDATTGDSLYEFHGYFDSMKTISEHITTAINLYE